MNSSKIKSIILSVLIILNIFLAIPLIRISSESKLNRTAKVETILYFLNEKNITINSNQDFSIRAPRPLTLIRSTESDKKFAEAFLGKSEMSELGGNMYFFRSNDAEAVFRGTGDADILINSSRIKKGKDLKKICVSLLKKGKAKLAESSFSIEETVSDTYCKFNLSYGGFEVFNAPITFDFCGDSLQFVTVSSIFLFSDKCETFSDKDISSAIVDFYNWISSTGKICSQIDSIDAGFVKSISVSGECKLKPVWKFMTDTGVFLLDAETGKTIFD